MSWCSWHASVGFFVWALLMANMRQYSIMMALGKAAVQQVTSAQYMVIHALVLVILVLEH